MTESLQPNTGPDAASFLPEGILEQHLSVIRESGFDAFEYADRIAKESIMLARAIRDHAEETTGVKAERARAAYEARYSQLENRDPDAIPDVLRDEIRRREGNPEVDRTGIISTNAADHNPDPASRPVNQVTADEDRTPQLTVDGSGDVVPDADDAPVPTDDVDQKDLTAADSSPDADDAPVKRGPGRPRKDAL